ncbi:MAG: hypothetical protein ACI4NE_04315 [Succinivibrio sp.]
MTTIEQAYSVYKNNREKFKEPFRVRIHRSLSWLKKSDALDKDELDLKLISLWISFNCLYGSIGGASDRHGDRDGIREFLNHISRLDTENLMYSLIWNVFSGPVRNLLDNVYTYQPFWAYYNGDSSYSDWKERFEKSIKSSKIALANQDIQTILFVIFDRIYTLRNQLIHGGATCGSYVNREQVKETCAILSELIPVICMIMMKNHDQTEFGTPYYQYIKE